MSLPCVGAIFSCFLWALSLLFFHAVALSLMTCFSVSISESSESVLWEMITTSGSWGGSCTGVVSWTSISSSLLCRFLKPHILLLLHLRRHVVVFCQRDGFHFVGEKLAQSSTKSGTSSPSLEIGLVLGGCPGVFSFLQLKSSGVVSVEGSVIGAVPCLAGSLDGGALKVADGCGNSD